MNISQPIIAIKETHLESPDPKEPVYIEQMIADLQGQLQKMYPPEKTLRQAHPKMHGCVKAEFTVLDGLAAEVRKGLFSQPQTYEAYIRFSNANSEIKHDLNKDVRGMAIKLFNVPGDKLHNEVKDAANHDFILIDSETFISRNVKEFSQIIHALSAGKGALAAYFLNPLHFPVLLRFIKSQKVCHHVLDTCYWSTTPYLFGDDKAVKYHVRPVSGQPVEGGIVKDDENFLRTNMKKTLAAQDVYFDFFVQFQADAKQMPVEDPTIKWTSPFVKVARIKIPKQEFDTDEQNHLGEDFSFSPWHCLPEHRPLGGLNRARRAVYYAMSNFWHSRNDSYTTEP